MSIRIRVYTDGYRHLYDAAELATPGRTEVTAKCLHRHRFELLAFGRRGDIPLHPTCAVWLRNYKPPADIPPSRSGVHLGGPGSAPEPGSAGAIS